MSKYNPAKQTYFIVTQHATPLYMSVSMLPGKVDKFSRTAFSLPEDYILYYCEYSSKAITKAQPITSLSKKSNLFDTTPAVIFNTVHTIFVQAVPDIMKDCINEVTLFEGKRFGFDNTSVMTLPSNVKKSDANSTSDLLITDSDDIKRIMDNVKNGKSLDS